MEKISYEKNLLGKERKMIKIKDLKAQIETDEGEKEMKEKELKLGLRRIADT